jgi:ribonuclease HI
MMPWRAIQEMYPPRSLKINWKKLAYTDGSLVKTSRTCTIGSGVFIPNQDMHGHAGTSYMVDPCGKGITNTVNRAELVAILYALQKGCDAIATDSTCALYLINKMINRPWRLINHTHYVLLQRIAEVIREHPSPRITLLKVPAHKGVVGNVMADLAAKDAEHRIQNGWPGLHAKVEVGNNPNNNKCWLRSNHEDHEHNPCESHELSDMRDCLKNHMRGIHSLGYSNTDSVYFKAWQQLIETADTDHSNHFMIGANAQHAARRTMLQYRTGTLWTNKMAHRFDAKHSSKCPLCSQEDGGHHALSACPVIADTIGALRHNAAGRAILKAISTGSRGADLIMADVGNKDTMQNENLGHLQCRIPEWIIPSRAKHEATHSTTIAESEPMRTACGGSKRVGGPTFADLRNKYKPDGLMVKGQHHNEIGVNSTVTIIEIKYCEDTRPEQQRDNAAKQHESLKLYLKETWNCRIEQVTILLGVGGTIYKCMKDDLKSLGVEGQEYKRLAQELNVIAAEYGHKALNLRRHLQRSNGTQHSKGFTIPSKKGFPD